MIARVERISRINRTPTDIGSYGERQGYAENDGHSFERELRSAVQRQQETKVETPVPDVPYVLSVNRATQSLFYSSTTLTAGLGKYLNGNG